MKLRYTYAVVLTAVALMLTACGTSETDEASSDGFSEVKIKHALGTAEITDKPERVVTLGQGSAETSIALGVTPVGIEEYPWGADKTGYLPWIYEAVKERDDKLPEQFQGAEELDIKAIVKLKPDLILAPWSGVTQKQYDVLSDIAPTIAYPKEPWVITWEEQITTIGKALGDSDGAEKLIDGINEDFDEAENEDYADINFSYIYADGPGSLGVFYPGEQRAAFPIAMGLKPSLDREDLEKFDAPGTDSALIGLERADMLKDTDLVFTFYRDAKTKKATEGQKLYGSIPAIERGSVVASTDNSFVTASSLINPLTVPWALERYEPLIEKAIAKLDR